MIAQPCFPGFEAFLKPDPWSPQPHVLAKVKTYFEGFAAHERTIYARRKHIAAKLGIAVRTLARYLKYLADAGWLQTVKRTARTAIRQVLHPEVLRPIAGPSIEGTPEASQNPLKQNTTNAPSSGGEPGRGREQNLPVGFVEPFREFMAPFYGVGKPMNRHDEHRAHAAFVAIGPGQWEAATAYAVEVCQRARHVRYVPMPVNLLLDEGWTRTAAPRTLPMLSDPVKTKSRLALESSIAWFLSGGGK